MYHQPTIKARSVAVIDKEFEAAVIELLPTLRRYALYLCKDSVAADDLTQDVAVRAFSHPPLRAAGANLKDRLLIIMRNSFMAARRDASADLCDPLDVIAEQSAFYDNCDARLDLIGIAQIWSCLHAHHREILMQVFDDQNYLDIANRFQIPLGTVQSRIHRARQALRREIDREYPERNNTSLH